MRRRDLSHYTGQIITQFPNLDSFVAAPIASGIVSVKHNKAPLDFLVVDRGSETTLVAFHSALTNKQRTVPVFSASGIASAAGVNLVAIADPSVALGVDLAWYLGSRGQGPIRPAISQIVTQMLKVLGSKRTILFGASGGGYAAAYYAPDFPESVALILNPRLDLSARPESAMTEYLSVCHKGNRPVNRIRADFVPERVADTYRGQMNHYLAILQNEGDRLYRTYQTDPFVRGLAHTGRVFVQYGQWGEGHRPVPKDVVVDAVTALSDASLPLADALSRGPFTRPAAAPATQPVP